MTVLLSFVYLGGLAYLFLLGVWARKVRRDQGEAERRPPSAGTRIGAGA